MTLLKLISLMFVLFTDRVS